MNPDQTYKQMTEQKTVVVNGGKRIKDVLEGQLEKPTR